MRNFFGEARQSTELGRSQSECKNDFLLPTRSCLHSLPMKHDKSLLRPAEALYRALLPRSQLRWSTTGAYQPFQPQSVGSKQRQQPPPPRQQQQYPQRQQEQSYPQRQQYAQRQYQDAPPARSSGPPPRPQLDRITAKKLESYTLNEAIQAEHVQVRNADGRLEPPQPLRRLLDSLSSPNQLIRQLAAQGETPGVAVVQITDVDTLLKAAAEREQVAKDLEKSRKENKPKQIELNWAISENDLSLKFKQLEQFLDKGRKVEVLLAAKKRQRKASQDEAEGVMRRLKSKVEELGAKELKSEGRVGGQVTFTVIKKKD